MLLLDQPGRLALIGLVVAAALAVFLGFFIPSIVEKNLIDSRTEMYAQVANDMVDDGLIDTATASPTEIVEFDLHVRHRLVGADVLRVVLWDKSGTAIYSDAPELVGLSTSSDQITRAFGGEIVVDVPSATEGEFELIPDVALVREYYVPITDETGAVLGVFEVYEDGASISSTLSSTRKAVWFSIIFGLGMLFVFLLSLSRASLRFFDWRRREAERLAADIGIAQKGERERITETLHDGIGQPLYRVLYGLEGSRSRMDRKDPIADELDRLSGLVRWIDGVLRSELLMLSERSGAAPDLVALLHGLVEDVRVESRLEIGLTITGHQPLPELSRAALFRATGEAVANARKHAGASKVDIIVAERGRRVIVDVEDDGIGFRGNAGLGLGITRERLEAIGGGLKLLAAADGGTLFRAWVPLPSEGDLSGG
jgi:signal transduction histidine kinase